MLDLVQRGRPAARCRRAIAHRRNYARSDARLRYRPAMRLHCGAFGGRRCGSHHGRPTPICMPRSACILGLLVVPRATCPLHSRRCRAMAVRRRDAHVRGPRNRSRELSRRSPSMVTGHHGQPQERRFGRCTVGPGRVAQEAGRKRPSSGWARVQPDAACQRQRRDSDRTMDHSWGRSRLVGW